MDPQHSLEGASAADLHALSQSSPHLRPAIAAHPAAYDGLLQWLAQDPDPQVQAALAARRAGQLPWQQAGSVPSAGTADPGADAVATPLPEASVSAPAVPGPSPWPTSLPATDLPTADLPTTSLPTTNLPTTSLPATDLPTASLPVAASAPVAVAPGTQDVPLAAPTALQPAPAGPAASQPGLSVPAVPVPPVPVPLAPAAGGEAGLPPALSLATASPRAKRGPSRKLIALISVVTVLVLVLAGLGVTALLAHPETVNPAASRAATAPTKVSALQIAEAKDSPARVQDMDSSGTAMLQTGSRWVTRVSVDGTQYLVAGDSTTGETTPVWQVALTADAEDQDCRLVEDVIVCGSMAVTAADGQETEPLTAKKPLTAKTQLMKPMSQASVSGYTAKDPERAWVYEVSSPAKVAGVTVPGRGSLTQIVLDGQNLAAVVDGSVAWQKDLGEGSVDVNGASQTTAPQLEVIDGIVVTAAQDGVVGLSMTDGEPVWSVPEGEITGWVSDGTDVLVSAGDEVSRYTFAASAPEADATSPAATTPPPTPVDVEALKNGSVQVPAGCAAFSLRTIIGTSEGEPGTALAVTLTDGKASDPQSYGSVTLTEAVAGTMNGQAVAAATFDCFGGGAYSYGVVGLYSSELALIGTFDSNDGVPFSLGASDPKIGKLAVSDDGVTFDLTGFRTVGDGTIHASPTSGHATITTTLDGAFLKPVDIVHHTSNGDVRTPKLADIDAVLTAIGQDQLDSVRDSMTDEAYEEINEGLGEDGSFDQKPLYGAAHAVQCDVVGGDFTGDFSDEDYYFKDGKTLTIAYGPKEWLTVGSFLCELHHPQWDASGDMVSMYLILQGNPEGAVKITHFGRTFS